MAKEMKTEKASSHQSQLCNSLVCLMEDMSYQDITVSSICAHANIPRRTFYYYFDCKQDVLLFLIRGLIMESDLESMICSAPTDTALEQGLTRFFLYWKEKRCRELRILAGRGLEQEFMNYCMGWVREEPRWAHLVEHYTEEEYTVSLLLGISCVMYTLFHWCTRNFQQSPEYMAACVTKILTKPLYTTF